MNVVDKYNILSLLKFDSQRRNFLITCFLWFSTSGIYYGLSIFLKTLPGDIYTNGYLLYTVEFFAYFLTGFIINIKGLGRRNTMIIFEFISLVGYGLMIFFNFQDYTKTILALVARFAISGVYNTMFTYSTEVFPTCVRSKAFGTNSACARVGAIISPICLELMGEQKVPILFAILNGIAFITLFFIPETLGKGLEEHIPEETAGE